jgi:hypothetical protein
MVSYLSGKHFKVRIQISPGEFFERTTWSDSGSSEQAAVDTIFRIHDLGLKTGYNLKVETVEAVEPAQKI